MNEADKSVPSDNTDNRKQTSDELTVNDTSRNKGDKCSVQFHKSDKKQVKMVSVQTIATITVKVFKIVSIFCFLFWFQMFLKLKAHRCHTQSILRQELAQVLLRNITLPRVTLKGKKHKNLVLLLVPTNWISTCFC